MTRDELINLVLNETPTTTLLGFAKEFVGKHPAAYEKVIKELKKRPGVLKPA